MRAPPSARMAAVAAPRPDAEPVTIAHKPSFDIRISPWLIERRSSPALFSELRNPCKSAKLRRAELILAAPPVALHVAGAGPVAETAACHGGGFSSSCGARKDRRRGPELAGWM